MKYTHKDIEADRVKPVGSLFNALMDGDSYHPSIHRCEAARERYDKSLAGTALCLYPDSALPSSSSSPPGAAASARDGTPLRGKRRFAGRANRESFALGAPPAEPQARPSRPDPGHADHLAKSLVPRCADGSGVGSSGRRHVPEPRRERHADPITGPWHAAPDDAAEPQPQPRRSARAGGGVRSSSAPAPLGTGHIARRHSDDHLGVSTLLPREEAAAPRPVPEPMVLRPRTKGIRLFPEMQGDTFALFEPLETRSVTGGRGVKRLEPPPHWKSVTEKQTDFLTFGVARQDSSPAAALRTRGRGAAAADHSGRSSSAGRDLEAERQQRWRAPRRSASGPPPRSFNIITGLAC